MISQAVEECRALAKSTLPEKRYLHTLEVEKEAVYLSGYFPEIDGDAIRRASLLHDITKYLSTAEHYAVIGDALTEDDKKSPETLHAKSGAVKAKELGEKYYSAVECHTTGKSEMSIPEMILFLADYTEATRRQAVCLTERERLHRELESNKYSPQTVLEHSVLRVLNNTVQYLQETKAFIHPRTLDAAEYYGAKEKNEKGQ